MSTHLRIRTCADDVNIISSHADYNRDDFFMPREQSRHSGKLVHTRPPLGPNWAVAGCAVAGVIMLLVLMLVIM